MAPNLDPNEQVPEVEEDASGCCQRQGCFRGWNGCLSRCTEGCIAKYTKCAISAPWFLIVFSVAVSLVLTSGVYFRFVQDQTVDLAKLWLPPGTWYESDRALYESAYGVQNLEQIIVVAKGGNMLAPATENKSGSPAMLEAFDLFTALQAITVYDDESNSTLGFGDFCYKPILRCLFFSPFNYWGTTLNRSAIETDQDPGLTLNNSKAPGSFAGVFVVQEMVLGGISRDKPGAGIAPTVVGVEAVMLWIFIDKGGASPKQLELIAAWEKKYLDIAAKFDQTAQYTHVYRKTMDSLSNEIQLGVNDDMFSIYLAVALPLLGFVVVFFVIDSGKRTLTMLVLSSLGMTIGSVWGLGGYLINAGMFPNYPGDAMLFFLLITLGILHRFRVMIRYRQMDPTELDASERVKGTFRDSAPSFTWAMCVTSLPLIVGYSMTELPAMKMYAFTCGVGILIDYVVMMTFVLGCITILARGDNRALEKAPLIDRGKAALRGEGLSSSQKREYVPHSGELRGTRNFSTAESYLLAVEAVATPNVIEVVVTRCYSAIMGSGLESPSVSSVSRGTARALVWSCLAVAGSVALIAYGANQIRNDWTPALSSSNLVPDSSYMKGYATQEAKYFLGTPVPIDFPLVFDLAGARSAEKGPIIMELAQRIQTVPNLDQSSFRNVYGVYTEWCKTTDTLSAPCARNMINVTNQNGSFEMFPGPRCWTTLITGQFLASAVGLPYAADFVLGPRLNPLQVRMAVSSVYGAFATYEGQRDIPLSLHDFLTDFLAEKGLPKEEFYVFSFAASFPYFQVWGPAENFLYNFVYAAVLAACLLCLLTLEPLTAFKTIFALFTIVITVVGFVYARNDIGFSLIMAPAIIGIPLVSFEFVFHIGYRATQALRREPSVALSHVTAAAPLSSVLATSVMMMLSLLVFSVSVSPINNAFQRQFEWLLFVGMLTVALVNIPLLIAPLTYNADKLLMDSYQDV